MRDTSATRSDSAHAASRPLDLPNRTLLIVTALFWLYVTASNVLYAQNIQIEVGKLTGATVFGPWQQRVLQHVLLFPLLLACYWGALRLGWASAWRTALQVALGAGFAALSFWAMVAAILMPDLVAPVATRMASEHPEAIGALWFASFVNFLLNYAFGFALVTGLALYRRFHATELRVVTLEREWSAARLNALRLQLSPHTLFNLLHTIRGQIVWEPEVAQTMMVQFADLLRRSLNASERDFSPLADELEFARLYLELQQRRFGDRLAFSLPERTPEPPLWVPSLDPAAADRERGDARSRKRDCAHPRRRGSFGWNPHASRIEPDRSGSRARPRRHWPAQRARAARRPLRRACNARCGSRRRDDMAGDDHASRIARA